MTKKITNVEVRLARIEDREAVLAFCQDTWENQSDYIHLVWDKWLTEPQSRLFVAVVDEKPVAMERVVLLSDLEAWWEGLRVARPYRGRGLVKVLDSKIEQFLLEAKVKISRSCTSSENTIMHYIMERQGRKKISCYTPYKTDSITSPLTHLVQLESQDFQLIWELMTVNNFLNQKQVLFVSRGAKWQELTSYQLRTRLEQGLVWGIKQDNELTSLAIESYLEGSRQTYWIGYINGKPSSLTILLQQLRCLAHHKGYSAIGGIFLSDELLLTSLEKAGYLENSSENYWVYQWTNF